MTGIDHGSSRGDRSAPPSSRRPARSSRAGRRGGAGGVPYIIRRIPFYELLSEDGFREVGPGKHFLGCAHTLANYRNAFYDSALADNRSFEQWRDDGEKDAEAHANARWKDLLAAYEPPPLDPAIDEALVGFMTKKKESMSDAWY